MSEQRNLEEIGLEAFAVGQTPISAAVTDTNSVALAADADRAYSVVTLLSVTSGFVFLAQGAVAEADKGQMFAAVGSRLKIFGSGSVQVIAGEAAQTATLGIQEFKRGLPRQGTAV